VTFHVMNDQIDSGPILDVDLFPIAPGTAVLALEETAYAHLAAMFWRWAGALANQGAPLSPRLPTQRLSTQRLPTLWGRKKNSRRSYQALCRIPLDISKEDLTRRMSIFGASHFGISPSINLHGFEFRAVDPTD